MGLNVIMLGAPGAGKGTQAERFARRRGLPKISTGDILRQGVRDQNKMASAVKAKIDCGELVDDMTVVTIVLERLAQPDTDSGFILDGFPRTVPQARALDAIMETRGKGPLLVVEIVVPEADLVGRLAGRRICSTCGMNADPADGAGAKCQGCGGALAYRSDDSEEVVLQRLMVYKHATRPLVDYYNERPTFCRVNGAQATDCVEKELGETIDVVAARVGAILEARGPGGR